MLLVQVGGFKVICQMLETSRSDSAVEGIHEAELSRGK